MSAHASMRAMSALTRCSQCAMTTVASPDGAPVNGVPYGADSGAFFKQQDAYTCWAEKLSHAVACLAGKIIGYWWWYYCH